MIEQRREVVRHLLIRDLAWAVAGFALVPAVHRNHPIARAEVIDLCFKTADTAGIPVNEETATSRQRIRNASSLNGSFSSITSLPRPDLSFHLRHPDVAGGLDHAEHQLIGGDAGTALCKHGAPRTMEVIELLRGTKRTLGIGNEVLGPDAFEAVPQGKEIKQISIGRPPGL